MMPPMMYPPRGAPGFPPMFAGMPSPYPVPGMPVPGMPAVMPPATAAAMSTDVSTHCCVRQKTNISAVVEIRPLRMQFLHFISYIHQINLLLEKAFVKIFFLIAGRAGCVR